MCDGYNGWKNYETWSVNIWLSNSEGDQEWLTEIINNHPTTGASACQLRDEIKDITNEACYQEDGTHKISPMLIDILRAGVDLVDYHEIITNNLELKDPRSWDSITRRVEKWQGK